jgi:hypothetical protein
MTADELDGLDPDRQGLRRADLLAALKAVPGLRPWAVELTENPIRNPSRYE